MLVGRSLQGAALPTYKHNLRHSHAAVEPSVAQIDYDNGAAGHVDK